MSTETTAPKRRRYTAKSHDIWCREQGGYRHTTASEHNSNCTAAFRATLTPVATETPKRERKRSAVAPKPIVEMTVSELTVALSDAWAGERTASNLYIAAQLHRSTMQGEVRRRREALAKLDETDPLISTTLPAKELP